MHKSKRSQIAVACGDGEQRTLETTRVSTPIGEMILCICGRGLHTIYQKDEITDENFHPDPSQHISLMSEAPKDEKVKSILDNSLEWLETYFHRVESASQLHTLPLCTVTKEGASFRERVLISLLKNVSFGKTITYGELASLTGSPGAQLAVGTAMSTNPFQLVVPCHRVVKSGNQVGKYSGGCRNSVKIWLLQHEGMNVDQKGIVSHAA